MKSIEISRLLRQLITRQKYIFAAFWSGLLFAIALCCAAQKTAPLPVETAVRARTLRKDCPIDLSPDGNFIAYTVRDETRRTTEVDARYRVFGRSGVSSFAGEGNDIFITDLKTGASRNLTQGRGTSWTPSWSPDGKTLAFYSDRDGAARIWLWDRTSGRLRRAGAAIVRPLFANEKIYWMPNGKTLLVKLLPEKSTLEKAAGLLTVRAVEDKEKKVNGATVYVYRGVDIVSESSGLAVGDAVHLFNRGLADLAAIDVTSGKTERLAKNIHLRSFRLSPSGEKIAFLAARRIVLNPPENLHDLSVLTLKSKKIETLQTDIEGLWSGEFISWSPDEKFIAAGSLIPQKTSRLLIFNAAKSNETRTFDLPLETRPANAAPLWNSGSNALYFIHLNALWKISLGENKAEKVVEVSNHRLTEIVAPFGVNEYLATGQANTLYVRTFSAETLMRGIYRIDLQNKTVALEREKNENYGTSETTAVSADRRIFFTLVESAAQPPDIWAADVSFSKLRRITHIEEKLAEYQMGASRLIEYQTAKGQKLRAALLLPADYEKGKRYPLIAYVYGGINLSSRANDYGMIGQGINNMQLFASRGYAVLLPDLPTRSANVSTDLTEMITPALDKAVELGIADKNRIGVMGHSFGGYTTLSLIAGSDRFRAAAMVAGFGNIIGLYGAMRSDGEAFNVEWWEKGPHGFGAAPWKVTDKYLKNSPVFHLDRVKTPLLIVHGAQDVSTPPFLADEVFVGLRRLGTKVVYAKYENEGHNPAQWGYANQLDYGKRVIEWFDEHLKNQEILAVRKDL